MGTAFSRPSGDMPGEFSQPADEAAALHSLSPLTTQEVLRDGRPYPPSWVDTLTDWVRRLPLPSWVFYLSLGLGLTLVYLTILLSSVGWTSDPLVLTTIVLYSFLNGMTFVYLLGLIHYLDNSAATGLARFRPVLTVDQAGYNKLCYQLTTLPARPTLIASFLGIAYTFVTLLMDVITVENQTTGAISPVEIVLVWGINLVIYVLVAVVVYHTLHQLSVVNAIYTKHARIDLFQLGPLYALSNLTARNAIGIAIPTYAWFQINSIFASGTSASDIIQTVFLGIIIVVTFISPLLGAHRLLEREKQRLQDEVARRIKATITTLHSLVDTGELGNRGALKDTLDGLVTEQHVIDKLRTWPWRTETVSSLGLAFLLPIIIWVVQRLLERLGV